MGQETTVRTLHGTTDWFKIGKGVWQGCILSHCLFNLHAEWVSEWMKATELCPTIWDPMDYTVHGILQARVLEWVAIPFSRGSSQPRDQTQVSRIVGGLFFFLSFFLFYQLSYQGSPYAEYIMWNARLDDSQAGIKILGRNINNLRYPNDFILMAESEEGLNSLLKKMKEESKKADLKLNIQKTKILAFGPITSWQIEEGKLEAMTDFIFLDFKITMNGDCSHEIKRCMLLGRKGMTNLDSISKSRDITLPTKGL